MINRADNHGGSDSYATWPCDSLGERTLQAPTTQVTTAPASTTQTPVAPDLDAKGLLLRDALAILTVVGALVAFYGMIRLVSYLSGIPFP